MDWENGVTMTYDGTSTFTFTDAKGNTAAFSNDSIRDIVVNYMQGPGKSE